MDDQELDKARANALIVCRTLCEGVAQANERLPVSAIKDLLAEVTFTEQIFDLSAHENRNWINSDTWIELLKFNLRKYNDDIGNQELILLLESTLHMHTNSEEGKIIKSDMIKILGSSAVGNLIIKRICAKKVGRGIDDKVDLTVNEFMDFIATVTAPWSHKTISNDELERSITIFKKYAGTNQYLTTEDFGKILSTKNKFFTERAFRIFDQNNDGKVSLDEYTETLRKLADNNIQEAIKFLFRVYDSDGNGNLHQNEMIEALKASMEENGMKFDTRELTDLCKALWEDAGVGDRATMTFPDFKNLLIRHQGLSEGLAQSITRWLIPKERSHIRPKFGFRDLANAYKSNKVLVNFILVFILINLGLCIWRFVVFYYTKNYDNTGPNVFFMIARGNGMCLNFNSMMILFFILRYTVTLMRKMGLATKLPLDHHVYLHKFTGVLIFVQGWLHTIGHYLNFGLNIQPHPVEFVLANLNLFKNSTLKFPKNCLPATVTFEEDCAPYESNDFNLTKNSNTGQVEFVLSSLTLFENSSLQYPPMCVPQITFQEGCEGYNFADWMFTYRPSILGLISGMANPTGLGLIIILTVMVICSMPFVRTKGHFEVFYFTHLLYSAYFVLLIIHAPIAWWFMIVPLILFVVELLYRLVSATTGNLGKSFVTAGLVLPSKVTGLVIQKPTKFNFSPGDWVFVKIPSIAIFEWHPFTISSAPEQKETFTLHIRGVGGWTSKLYKFFEDEFQRQEVGKDRELTTLEKVTRSVRHSMQRVGKSGHMDLQEEFEEFNLGPDTKAKSFLAPYENMRRRPSIVTYNLTSIFPNKDVELGLAPPVHRGKIQEQRATLLKPLKIYIDGPYGAPASNFYRAQHAVLIGSGIGITPFSSILQSIMLRYWHNRRECPNCNHKWSDDIPDIFDLKKVDFFWINRDQRSFEWFFQLLTQLEIEQAEKGGMLDNFLDIHMYITSALQKSDMRAVGLQLAMDLLYEREKRDLVTGLKARTKAGRPDWNKVFADLQKQDKGDITVFFCGNPALGETVRKSCEKFGFKFKKEIF